MAEDKITIEVSAPGAEAAASAIDKVERAAERASDSVDSASASARDLSASVNDLNSAPARELAAAVDSISESSIRAADSMDSVRTAASEWGNIISGLESASNMLGGIKNATMGFVSGALQARAEAESLEHQLAAVAGSAEAGAAELKKIKEMANTTVAIDTEGAVKGVSAFMRMGESADDAREKLRILSNATAYVGGGAEQIKNAITQIEQLSARTSGFSQDILALQNSIPNAAALIRQHFGVESLEDLNNLGITGKEVFNGLIEEMSKLPTVEGGISETMERINAAQQEIAAGLGEAFAPALEMVAQMVSGLGEAINGLPDWGKDIIAWTTGIVGLTAAVGLGVTQVAQFVSGLKTLKDVGKLARDAIVKLTASKTLDTAATTADTAATAAGTIAQNAATAATQKGTLATIKDTIAEWANVAAKLVKQALSGPKGWLALAGGIAAIGVAGGMIYNWKKNNDMKAMEEESAQQGKEWLEKHNQKQNETTVAPQIQAPVTPQAKSLAGTDAGSQAKSQVKTQADYRHAWEAGNKANVTRIKNEGEIKYNDLMAKGEVATAKRAKAEAELTAVMSDGTATREQITLAQQKYNKAIGDIESGEISKEINSQKTALDKKLSDRKSYTNKIIAEIEKERKATDSMRYYEQGQMAVLTTGADFETEDDSPYTTEEVRNAEDAIRKKESLEKSKRQSVEDVLYGNSTDALQREADGIKETLQYLREQGQNGSAQVGLLNNIHAALQNLLRYAGADFRQNMA